MFNMSVLHRWQHIPSSECLLAQCHLLGKAWGVMCSDVSAQMDKGRRPTHTWKAGMWRTRGGARDQRREHENFFLCVTFFLSPFVLADLRFLIRFDFCHFKPRKDESLHLLRGEPNFISHLATLSFSHTNNKNLQAPQSVNCQHPLFPYAAR